MSPTHRALVIPGSMRTETRTYISEHTFITLACPRCHHEAEHDLDPVQLHRGTVRCRGCRIILTFDLNVAKPSPNVVPMRRNGRPAS